MFPPLSSAAANLPHVVIWLHSANMNMEVVCRKAGLFENLNRIFMFIYYVAAVGDGTGRRVVFGQIPGDLRVVGN